MVKAPPFRRIAAAGCLLLVTPSACAQPGDAEAVAQARKDYARAMKGHDIGLQNAMRAELAAQLAMSRKTGKVPPPAAPRAAKASGSLKPR